METAHSLFLLFLLIPLNMTRPRQSSASMYSESGIEMSIRFNPQACIM